jgi:hypothetical protein
MYWSTAAPAVMIKKISSSTSENKYIRWLCQVESLLEDRSSRPVRFGGSDVAKLEEELGPACRGRKQYHGLRRKELASTVQ